MISIARAKNIEKQSVESPDWTIDTTFVLFFLAVEFGQTVEHLGIDSFFLAITLLIVAIMPYFLPTNEKMNFGNWLLGRGLIVGLAILTGIALKSSLGVVLPETFKFLPMTLLILTAMLSCYFQFFAFLKFREIK